MADYVFKYSLVNGCWNCYSYTSKSKYSDVCLMRCLFLISSKACFAPLQLDVSSINAQVDADLESGALFA